MGGSIRCESELHKGSQFIFDILDSASVAASASRSIDDFSLDEQIPNEKQGFDNLPAKILHPTQMSSKPALLQLQRAAASKAQVLVVDDDSFCGKVTKAMIETCNVAATLVLNKHQA